jgi:hypothetical protein
MSFSLWEKVAQQRRMRANSPYDFVDLRIVERAPLTRRYRATLSQRERDFA